MKTILNQDLNEVKDTIDILYTDCEMALDGNWDRSDHGFMAMQDSLQKITKLLGLEDPEITDNYNKVLEER